MVNKKNDTLRCVFNPQTGGSLYAAWDDISFGMLLTLYLFQNPEFTQAKISEELGVTPMAVSRRMKNMEAKIPPKWYHQFETYICEIDFDLVKNQIALAEAMQKSIISRESIKALIALTEDYMANRGVANDFKLYSDWMRLGILQYENVCNGEVWSFFPLQDGMDMDEPQTIINIFNNRATGYREGKPIVIGEKTVLVHEKEQFDIACEVWEKTYTKYEDGNKDRWSLMLVDTKRKTIIQEFYFK